MILIFLIFFKDDPMNDSAKANIRAKVSEYLQRAEQIKTSLSGNKKKPVKTGNGDGNSKDDESGDETDKEKKKMMNQLEGSIVVEKPCVKWSDVAGLEGAIEALKEAVILPIKFPSLFTGNRKPWKGIVIIIFKFSLLLIYFFVLITIRYTSIWTTWYWKIISCESRCYRGKQLHVHFGIFI